MKKFIVLVLIAFCATAFYAGTATKDDNVNAIFLANWKACTKLVISGIAPVPVPIVIADIDKIDVSATGLINIAGKVTAKGEKLDLWQIQWFAAQVNIKQTTDAKTGTVTKVITVFAGTYPPGKLF